MSFDSRCQRYCKFYGDWNVERSLGTGSGGKSCVFLLSRDEGGWRQECALKIICLIQERGSYGQMPQYRRQEYDRAAAAAKESATREVLLMSQLRGKTNIVDYLDHRFESWEDESGFGMDLLIRMERLTDLRSRINSGHKFYPEEVRQLGIDICRALVLCHGKQIIHRDIKPENIFFNQDGDYKLGDFGIARIMSASLDSRASTSIGTPAYSAPEQSRGGYDQRVDLYSLGLVMYELLNGNRLPFADSGYVTESQIQLRISGAPIPAPNSQNSLNGYGTIPTGLPEDSPLASIVLKACAFHPQDRFASAEEMLKALERLTVDPTPPDHPKRPGLPRWLPIAAAAVAAAGILGALLLRHTHTWERSTCTTPRTCSVCGETSGEAPGHQWLDADCTNPKICQVCGQTLGQPAGHQWLAADCTTPATCRVCGATEGTPSGHDWQAVDCLNPPTCSRCGATQGTAPGHSWKAATCEMPEHCENCGAVAGTALGHDWKKATFLEPMTCKRCGESSGYPIAVDSISLEDEVTHIQDLYYDIMDRAEKGQLRKVQLANNATAFYDDYGQLVRLDVPYGMDGLDSRGSGYSRMYYFDNTRLFFAYIAGVDSHRLYFYDELLIRWIYQPDQYSRKDRITSDLTFSSDYLMWEALALEDARFYLGLDTDNTP